MAVLWIFLGIGVVIAFFFVAAYNSFVHLRESVKNGWAQILVQLNRRHDLVPNLVETAKGYLKHESGTLEAVIKARQIAVDASTVKTKQDAENFLTSTLRSLFAVTENYPELKANQQMIRLHEEITSTENRIAFARQYYNDEVNRYNVALLTFPNNVVAGLFNFQKEEFFQLDDQEAKKAPSVKF